MLPQIVLGGALVPSQLFSAPTATRWAFEALMSITGSGSDLAADVCWKLPPDVRKAMTLEDKKTWLQLHGLEHAQAEVLQFPGLAKFYDPAVDQTPPVEPAGFGDPPPEPVIPERPATRDNLTMWLWLIIFQEGMGGAGNSHAR